MYYILKLIAWFTSRLSERTLERLSDFISTIAFDIFRIRRRLIFRNLDIAFKSTLSSTEKAVIGRAAYRNFVMTIVEFVRGYYIDPIQHVKFANPDLVRDLLDDGKGVLILCMHMGNWEAMGAAVSRLIGPAYVIVKPVGSRQVDCFVEDVRKTTGFLSIKRSEGTHHIRMILEVLRRGEMVGFVMDQARPGEDRIPFFDVPAKTNSGLAVLYRKTKAPVVPAYAIRERFGYHTIHFLPPLELDRELEAEDPVKALTARFNTCLEGMIRRHPEQYFWLHNRWK